MDPQLRLPPKPKYPIPKLPLSVSSISDDELMELMVALTRWTDHLGGEVAKAEVEERRAETKLRKAEAIAFLKSPEKTNKARAERDLDPQVEELRDSVDLGYAKKKLLGKMYEAAERDAALTSRELTRRTGRHESNERRADRARP